MYIVSNQTQRAQRFAARPETDSKAYGEATESQSLLSTRQAHQACQGKPGTRSCREIGSEVVLGNCLRSGFRRQEFCQYILQ